MKPCKAKVEPQHFSVLILIPYHHPFTPPAHINHPNPITPLIIELCDKLFSTFIGKLLNLGIFVRFDQMTIKAPPNDNQSSSNEYDTLSDVSELSYQSDIDNNTNSISLDISNGAPIDTL